MMITTPNGMRQALGQDLVDQAISEKQQIEVLGLSPKHASGVLEYAKSGFLGKHTAMLVFEITEG